MLLKLRLKKKINFLHTIQLSNRTLLKFVPREIENAEMTEQDWLSMDIDSFKSINDTMGHDIVSSS